MNPLGASAYEAACGRLKKLLIASAVCVLFSVLIPNAYPIAKLAATLSTLLLFISALVVIVRDCRCPHCGKVIFLGALAATVCPRCKRSLRTGNKLKKSRK